jgi:hypothetical protein
MDRTPPGRYRRPGAAAPQDLKVRPKATFLLLGAVVSLMRSWRRRANRLVGRSRELGMPEAAVGKSGERQFPVVEAAEDLGGRHRRAVRPLRRGEEVSAPPDPSGRRRRRDQAVRLGTWRSPRRRSSTTTELMRKRPPTDGRSMSLSRRIATRSTGCATTDPECGLRYRDEQGRSRPR